MQTNTKLTLSLITSVIALSAGLAVASGTFGAIAVSPQTGKYAIVVNRGSRATAGKEALKQCKASNCVVSISFRSACGAVAQKGKAMFTGIGSTKEEAVTNAVQAGGKGTKAIAANCTK